ncbi:serine/threonine-protein kinase [Streptomyces sp. CBMA123]|uniref:serine/threonine-protein kinase n=1 Tax=Streptomyces sp. CBMA123 TaxID=1896313 RepID=UPI001661E191|nr:serine/threonine-protein kinase [Streptomyces sp. CBMA123]MBD0695104.1 hypothetical protein [Streptomyces sp. CBMA123]
MAEPGPWTGLPDGLEPLSSVDRRELGGYRLLGRLGAGGMGIVYLARSVTGRAAAVKVLRPELLRERGAQERFRREISVVSRIPEAFTAPLLDAEADDNGAWMATAFIPGLSLQQSVNAFGPFPAESLHTLWYGLLRALDSVHAAGVVHRDLKPSNVLLTPRGPRLIDFGISTMDGSTRQTSTGAIIGTPGYLAPEQVTGQRPVTAEADVFALGAVMSFAATGVPPFDGENLLNVIYNVLHDEPRLSSLPADLEGWVRSCLDKDPAARPTVDGLLGALSERQVRTAQRRIALEDWLPDAVSRATLRRAQLVLDLDRPYQPSPAEPPALPAGPATAETVLQPAPGEPAERLRQDGPSTGLSWRRPPDSTLSLLRRPAVPEPTTAPGAGPAATALPQSGPNPTPAHPRAVTPSSSNSADGPTPGGLLRTSASPIEAELPPPPRTGLRRRWWRVPFWRSRR